MAGSNIECESAPNVYNYSSLDTGSIGWVTMPMASALLII